MKSIVIFLGKLLVSTFAFILGMIVGGIVTTAIGMQPPTLPPEIDGDAVGMLMFATSPLLVLALYFVNRELAGGWLARSLMLFLLSWIAYSVNNALEAAIFTNYETGSWFTIVSFAPALFFCAVAVASLFPAHGSTKSLAAIWHDFFQQFTIRQWAWRMALAATIFMPIYYLFGLLVVPFVGEYYQQGGGGLNLPSLSVLLSILFARSLLFLVATLPIVIVWQGGRLPLVFRLGFALFVMVGLIYMLIAGWIAPNIRLIHSLEILADSLVYAGALAWLLFNRHTPQHTL